MHFPANVAMISVAYLLKDPLSHYFRVTYPSQGTCCTGAAVAMHTVNSATIPETMFPSLGYFLHVWILHDQV